MTDYDAIVVGAGHNGLTAAAVLQRGGMRTLCLEANTYSGGMAATVELIDGFRYEIAGSVQFPTAPQITKELGLDTLPTVDAEVQSVNLGDNGEEPMIFYRDPVQLMTHLGEKLGTEAVMRLEVADFPAIVVNDVHGGDLYRIGVRQYQELSGTEGGSC